MPIETTCGKCGRELRAPDAASGKTATCPGCGAAVRIPRAADVAPVEAEIIEPQPPRVSDNPFQSPAEQSRPTPAKVAGHDDGLAMRMLLPVGRSWLAIVAGYLGLVSLLCVPAPLALLFGILAVIDIRRNPHKHGMGRAVFGIVMGVLGSGLLMLAVLGALAEGMGDPGG